CCQTGGLGRHPVTAHRVREHGIERITAMNTTIDDREQPITAALVNLTEPSAGELNALHRRLEGLANTEGLLDVAYTTVDSPVGSRLLAATGVGGVRVAFEREGLEQVLETLSSKVSARSLKSAGRLDVAARQLDEYFAGQRTAFDLPLDYR